MNETTNNKLDEVLPPLTISLLPQLERETAVESTTTSQGPVSQASGSTPITTLPLRFTRTSSQLIAPRPFSGTCRRTSVSSVQASSSLWSLLPVESLVALNSGCLTERCEPPSKATFRRQSGRLEVNNVTWPLAIQATVKQFRLRVLGSQRWNEVGLTFYMRDSVWRIHVSFKSNSYFSFILFSFYLVSYLHLSWQKYWLFVFLKKKPKPPVK